MTCLQTVYKYTDAGESRGTYVLFVRQLSLVCAASNTGHSFVSFSAVLAHCVFAIYSETVFALLVFLVF